MRFRQVFSVAVLALSVVGCGGGSYSTENSDATCKGLLAKGLAAEARDWIRANPTNTVGEIQTNAASTKYVDSIYALGSPHVYVVDFHRNPRGESAGILIAELSDDKAARARLLAWATEIVRKQGFDGFTDAGQQYVFVVLR